MREFIVTIVFFVFNLFFFNTANSQVPPLTLNEVSIPPVFVGGQKKLNEFVGSNFVVPEIEGVTGVIKVSFVIEVDGTLSNIKIIQSPGEAFSNEAKRVFLKSPKWVPGEQNGEFVRVQMNYPIRLN